MGKAFDETAFKIATSSYVPWDKLAGKVIVITGATGLIGKTLVASMLAHNKISNDVPVEIIVPVRNVKKAKSLFGSDAHVTCMSWDASKTQTLDVSQANYIIHGASPTASYTFMERPVETINAIVRGMYATLNTARTTGARLVFLSSMEVYGQGSADKLAEDAGGALDSMNVRNSYPEAKQLSEALCAAYAAEYGVKACVARLAQCFGPGISKEENRLFSQITRDCMSGQDIVLQTAGLQQNMYVSTQDAATAILLLACCGKPGWAYNVANEDTLISIREMAEQAAAAFGRGKTAVLIKEDPEAAKKYRSGKCLMLDSTRLCALGWKAQVGLMEMYRQMIDEWKHT